MHYTGYIFAAIGGYILGSIPFGLVLTRLAGLGDIRQIGSGNIGATNVLRTGRKDIALATLVLDAAKAGIALMVARMLWGSENQGWTEVGFVAGGAAFLGHCYPIWLNFKGGKGVATYFGVLFAGLWPLGIVAGAIWLGVAAIFRYSSLAALAAVVAVPIFAVIGSFGVSAAIFTALLAVLIFWRHSANIARLRAGTEPRIGAKKEAAEAAPVAEAPATEPPAEF